MFEHTKRFCDSFLDFGVPGFDLAVYQDGRSILRYRGGYSDIEKKNPIQGNERYNIYSCSKPITCTAALQLWEKGLFSLEDKLSDYLPEFSEMTVRTETGLKKVEKPILIKNLFEMTAGFSYETVPQIQKCMEETNGTCPTRELMKYLAKEPLFFEPGERWEYSLCHDVLAALVEVISGEKFENYVKKNVFDVVGMNDSTFMLPECEIETISPQYRFVDGAPQSVGKHIRRYKFGTEYASGGAGGISTVDDYMKFLEGLRTHKLLKAETLKMMCTDRLSERQKRTYSLRNTHGYGLGVWCPIENETNTDFGWGGAAGAYLAVDTERGLSLYFGMHLFASPIQGFRSLLFRMVKADIDGDQKAMEKINNDLKNRYNVNLTY